MIYFITGGARSGKSTYAMKMAKQLAEHPVYLATARQWDEGFQQRIQRHKNDRDSTWTTIEEEKYLGKVDLHGKTVVIDCVTLWLTNIFFDNGNDIEKSLDFFKSEIHDLLKQKATLIVVSNEIGMGVHAMTDVGRRFTDLQGWANQHVAQLANEVYLMVSGIPVKIK